MASDSEEDFPLNAGSDKLDKLFENNTEKDITFKFTPPKHSTTRVPKPLQNTVPLKVIHGKTVEAFQLKVGGYKSEGKVGLAIIGNDDFFYYQLYMYRSDERKVASGDISFQFNFHVQEHNYASFKDSFGIQWSVHFDKTSDLINFSKEIALARWKSTPSCQYKLIQEAFKGRTEYIIKKSDNVKVNYKVHKFYPDSTRLEEEFSERVVSAPANSAIWETTLVGACLKSRRFVILSSEQCETPIDLSSPQPVMLDLEIEEIIPTSESNDLSLSSLGAQVLPLKKSSLERKESGNLSERMSRIGYALPNLQNSETERKYDLPEETKPIPVKPLTPISSASVITREEYRSLSDADDLSITTQFNVLFSEVRTNNSEIRMSIGKMNDKVDTIISKLECDSQTNFRTEPMMEKIENLDGVLSRLLEQSDIMKSLLEKNSLSNFQSTLNEVVQLKKRNSELESLLELAGSSSQILKQKVDELNSQLLDVEKLRLKEESTVCARCNGSGDNEVKVLEKNLRALEDKNIKLLQTTESLERQNRELSRHTISAIEDINRKEQKIESLRSDVERLNLELLKKYSKQAVEKEITEVAKALMNRAYKTLKTVARDSSTIDHSFADALREMTKNYLEKYFEQKGSPRYEHKQLPKDFDEVPSLESYMQQGKPPLLPNFVPLPVPRSRKIINQKELTNNQLEKEPENSETIPPLTQNVSTENMIGVDNSKEINDNFESLLETVKNTFVTNSSEITDSIENRFLKLKPVLEEEAIPSLSDTEIENNNATNNKHPQINNSDSNKNSKNEKEMTEEDNSKFLNSSNSKDETSSYFQSSYSSSFYPPFIPNTPPPIMEDNSE